MQRAALSRLRDAMTARVERGELPGCVLLVAQDDDVHVDAIGVKAFGGTEPMRRETLFRIASMTKPVLGVATLQLVEDGTLQLGDPIERWLPEMAKRRVLRRVDGPLDDTEPAMRSITVEDLLTFRMGHGLLMEPTYNPDFPIVLAGKELELVLAEPDPRTPHPPDEWIRRFGTLPLMDQPGEHWRYNTGSLVLGVLLARASGQSLGDLFASRIFEPLGMRDTGFWLPAERTADLPDYVTANPESGQMERRDVSTPEEWSRPPAFPSGSGGLVSTVDDVLRFARMLLNLGEYDGGQLLSKASVREMTRNQLTPEQIATGGMVLGGGGWGYQVGVVTEPSDAWPVPGRYGWSGGYGTVRFNDRHRGIVAILMTQVSDVLWNGTLDEFETLVGSV